MRSLERRNGKPFDMSKDSVYTLGLMLASMLGQTIGETNLASTFENISGQSLRITRAALSINQSYEKVESKAAEDLKAPGDSRDSKELFNAKKFSVMDVIAQCVCRERERLSLEELYKMINLKIDKFHKPGDDVADFDDGNDSSNGSNDSERPSKRPKIDQIRQ